MSFDTFRYVFIRYKSFEEAVKAMELYAVQFGLKAAKPDNSGPVDAALAAATQAALLRMLDFTAVMAQKIIICFSSFISSPVGSLCHTRGVVQRPASLVRRESSVVCRLCPP